MIDRHVVEGRQIRFTSVSIFAMAALVLMTTAPAAARTISVPGNAPSIKGAMIQARAGDIILVSCGTYREADIRVKPGVSLWSGTLQPDCVTIDAGGQGRCLIFSNADSTTNVVGFTLRGGKASGNDDQGRGGAVFCDNSAPTLTRCNFVDNTAEKGGALATSGQRGPLLKQCRFERNEASKMGGAIHWTSAGGSLQGCTLVQNHALFNGGALAAQDGRIRLSDCLIRLNSAGNTGGGFSFHRTDAVVLRSVLAENLGGLAGGALSCQDASPTFRHCTFHGNDADGAGTVLSLDRANPSFESCVITGSGSLLVEATDSRPTLTGSNVMPTGAPGATVPPQWPGILAQQQESAGNLAVDPRYCAPEAGDFHLQNDSPCLALEGSGHIGALGQGCGAQFPADVVD